jgi:hypothetical protein
MGFKDVSDAATVKGPTIGQARCVRDTQFPDIVSIFPNAVGAGLKMERQMPNRNQTPALLLWRKMVSSDDQKRERGFDTIY